jgi:hypothetical protein
MKLNIVPPRTGMAWVKLGIRTFLRQPLALAGLFFMYMAVVLVISQIPLPAAGRRHAGAGGDAGPDGGHRRSRRGRFPMPTVLVSAFRAGRQRAAPCWCWALVYTAGSLLATGLGSLVGGDPPNRGGRSDEAPQLDVSMLVTLAAAHAAVPDVLARAGAGALARRHAGQEPVLQRRGLLAQLRRAAGLRPGLDGRVPGVGIVLSTIGMLLGGAGAARSVMMPTRADGGDVLHLPLLHLPRQLHRRRRPHPRPPISDGEPP